MLCVSAVWKKRPPNSEYVKQIAYHFKFWFLVNSIYFDLSGIAIQFSYGSFVAALHQFPGNQSKLIWALLTFAFTHKNTAVKLKVCSVMLPPSPTTLRAPITGSAILFDVLEQKR